MDQESNLDAVLERKSNRRVLTIEPTDSVYEAIHRLAKEGVGALLVVDEGRLVGVVSERDYARKVVLHGRSSKETLVSEIMTRRVVFARPQTTVAEALAIMNDRRIRHLPVMRDESIYGVVSIGDLVHWIIESQRFRIEELESYISGRYPA